MFWQKTVEKKTNPVGLFLTWKSKKEDKSWTFVWWNKELEQEIEVLPSEFILLTQTSCIKWWDNKSSSWIYSNEVSNVKKDTLVVRAFKEDEPLYEWPYDKAVIENLWWVYHKWVIALEWETLVEYYLKWWALWSWNEDTKWIDTNTYKVKLDKIEEQKKWAVIYYVPRRTQWAKITDKEREVALMNVELLNDYFSKDE